MAQLFYEDVEEGSELPGVKRLPTTRTLVMWAVAANEYYELHYDKDYATAMGFPSPVVPGRLGAAFLSQMLTDWVGDKGELKRLNIQYRGNSFPGQEMQLKGRVTRKYVDGGENLVECQVWIEDTAGQKITQGMAVVALPCRS